MKGRGQELQQRPELRQYMLPTLVYYLKLIELPNLEVETYLRQEIESNPLLEEVAPESSEETDTGEDTDRDNDIAEEQIDMDDISFLELFSDTGQVPNDHREIDFDPMDNVPAQEDRLYDKLMRQAREQFSDRDLEIAEFIISNIEDDGYLTLTPEDICDSDYTMDRVTAIISKIQRFEPIGCAWRDVREPLLIQLSHTGYAEDSLEYILVRDYFKELKCSSPREILKNLDITEDQFQQAKEHIMKLDPKPGWRCSGTPSRYVNPDFMIYWDDNKLCAGLHDENPIRVRIRRYYLQIIKARGKASKEEIAFVKQRIQSAQNLIIAIEQRRKTLMRIINGILEYQRDFFEKGDAYMKPMTMTEFAKQLGVNPSTISRALANKYCESPRGIHKLKFFFTAAVGHTDKRVIFEKIKAIVDNEDKTSPLSDTQIAKRLSREGIIISRRTISKYRDLLRISAHQFRRE
jgi:RNA polymerase sigma-54 factor